VNVHHSGPCSPAPLVTCWALTDNLIYKYQWVKQVVKEAEVNTIENDTGKGLRGRETLPTLGGVVQTRQEESPPLQPWLLPTWAACLLPQGESFTAITHLPSQLERGLGRTPAPSPPWNQGIRKGSSCLPSTLSLKGRGSEKVWREQ
jgi:hypothetical protein